MNCDAIQNRLLALPDLRRVPGDLRSHLDGCPACRTFLTRAARLDGLLAAIPVPPSTPETKAAFLDRVNEAGPIIRHVPVVRRRDSALKLPAILTENGQWRYAAGLAAAVLVAAGWLAFWGNEATKPAGHQTIAGHDLLKKTVGRIATDKDALARATTSDQRMQVWTNWTGDLRDEVKKVHLYAPPEDLDALATLFDKAAQRGLLEQARKVADPQTPADRRRAAFDEAIKQMAKIEADAATFVQAAPPRGKEPLQKIKETAHKVLDELNKLEPRQAGTFPGKGV